MPPITRPALARGSWPEFRRITALLRTESVGGLLLLVATATALVMANTDLALPYVLLRDTEIGADLAGFHLRMSLGHWAADGLLAVFFFLAGLELKQEFVAGDLRDPRRAVLPVAAAFGGVGIPAAIYALVNLASPVSLGGWAIPTATDIAFAMAVLAVIGSHLPTAMRTFLLTLAIVDDLIAICIIAIAYTRELHPGYLLAAIVPVVVYGLIANLAEGWFRRLWAAWLILLPLGLVTWVLITASGIHSTIAGVVLALTLPVHPADGSGRHHGLAHTLEVHLRPLSAGLCIPVFAFFSAGVTIGGWQGLGQALASPVTLGIIAGLVVGKTIGIAGTTFALTRLQHVELDEGLAWIDVVGLAALGGIGFTVSLLISELSFGPGDPLDDAAKIGVLAASLLAAMVASAILVPRNRHYRTLERAEQRDDDQDGIPDVFQRPEPA